MNPLLRSLDFSQQAWLLAAFTFVPLLLVSVAAAWSPPHEPQRGDDHPWRHWLRQDRAVLRDAWLHAGLLWLCWWLGQGALTALFAVASFLTLREFISLSPTRRGDHRSLAIAFFLVLPGQYALVAWGRFDLLAVLIPVYVFAALPALSALGNDPEQFLARCAKLQWGLMVCVYGMSHVPALAGLSFARGHSGFLVLFLVLVVQTAMLVQYAVARRLDKPLAPAISSSFHLRAWFAGVACGGLLGGLLAGLTPFKPGQALALALLASLAGTLGHLVMKAIKRDRGVRRWGPNARAVTGASGLLDKLDALCFAAPVFFHTARWYFGV